MKRILLPILLATSLVGCATPGASSRRACGVPDGAPCMSVPEVYRATEHADRVTKQSEARANYTRPPTTTLMIEGESLVLADQPQGVSFPVETPPDTVPLRTQARVMRIWVAPWTDAGGDLHMGGHLYTEIEPRKWAVGNTAPTAFSSIQPFQSSPPSSPDTSKPNTR